VFAHFPSAHGCRKGAPAVILLHTGSARANSRGSAAGPPFRAERRGGRGARPDSLASTDARART
jgi:hypothetical protein